MAFRTEATSVSTTPVRVFQAVAGDVEVLVQAQTAQVAIGGDDTVTTSTGFTVAHRSQSVPSGLLQFRVRPGDELWAVCATSAVVTVLARSA